VSNRDYPELDHVESLLDKGLYEEAAVLLSGKELDLQSDSRRFSRTLRANLIAFNGLGNWSGICSLGNVWLTRLRRAGEHDSLCRLHGHVGLALIRLGRLRDAESQLRAAIHVATWDLEDAGRAIFHQRQLAILFKNLGRWQQAKFEILSAIALADEHGIVKESGALRANLAIVQLKSGDFSDVPELLDTAETQLSAADKPDWLMQAKLARTRYQVLTRKFSAAVESLEALLSQIRALHYSREEAICLEYLGDCYLGQKEFKKALDHYQTAQRIADDTAPGGDLVPELGHRIGEVLVNLGDPNGAILACERGLRVARDTSDRYEECATHRVLAMANLASGNRTKAVRLAAEGISLGRSYEIPYELARVLQWAGETRLQGPEDEHAEGRRQLWEARGVYARLGLSQSARMIDEALGIEARHEPPSEEQARGVLEEMEDLDRGALLFGIITCNREMSDAVATIQSVAPSKIPVMITGPSGVGKELFARALHLMSDRRRGPFVPVNCGAISPGLIDSEFFGHERGAFTGAITTREGLVASAHQGTLFLDEIGDMPAPAQATLLRVLESGELRPVGRDDVRQIDIRIVAATNASLDDLVDRGLFRRDLFYRLNGASVTLPPLREREEDVRALFRYFWSHATSTARKSLTLSDEVEAILLAYSWPGNVRELKHEVVRVVTMAENGATVTPGAFLPRVRLRSASSLRRERERQLETDAERSEILSALRAHRGNKAEAARSLGNMKRTTLIYKIERLNIRPEEYLVEE
jgi:DNA-binding NtrC family response regulator/tetratricopeptide (TPR) repeat protein